MKFRSSYFQRFFWLHFCLIIPVVVSSVLVAGIIFNRVIQKEEEKLVRRLEDTGLRLYESVSDYSDEAVLLASRYELLRKELTGTMVEVRKAIEFLQLKKSLDSSFADLFIDFGTDKIYDVNGVTSKSLYISSLVAGREEEIERCRQLLSGDKSAVEILFYSDTEGYLAYSFYVDTTGENRRIFTYLLSFEQLGEILWLQDETHYYELVTNSGRSIVLGYDDSGRLSVIEKETWEAKASSKNYKALEEVIPVWDTTVRLYYDRDSLWLDDGLYQLQLVNIGLILLGIVLSAVISWNISSKNMKQIGALEATLKGEDAEKISEKSAFGQLQNSILNDLNNRKEFERKVLEDSHKLREARAVKIFSGDVSDKKELNLLFQELGFETYPRCFYVGAIATTKKVSSAILAQMLPCCLVAHSKLKDYEVVLFLYELAVKDENRVLRLRIADDIRLYIYEHLQETNVYIGMSKVYTDCKLINAAYGEAVYVLEKLISGEVSDFYRCLEDTVNNVSFLLPDSKGLQNFSQALQECDPEEAMKWLHYILSSNSVKGCTAENQEYIRFAVLQCLVQYLCQGNSGTNAHILRECLNIKVEEERKFVRSVENILKRCLTVKETDKFSTMLDYIEKNYFRSELTYEEVAAAGGISKTYLSKMFRAKMGMSYVEYLAQVRLNKACDLLKTTDYSINDIAKMVGYDNMSNFGRFFKSKYGVSAAQYRKRQGEKTEEE